MRRVWVRFIHSLDSSRVDLNQCLASLSNAFKEDWVRLRRRFATTCRGLDRLQRLSSSVPGPQPERLQTWDLRWQDCSPPSPSTSTELGSRKDLNSINEQAHFADSNGPSSIGGLLHERGNYVGDNKATRLDQARGHVNPRRRLLQG